MSRMAKDYGRCPTCNKKLRRTAERCTECGRLFKVYKKRYPNKNDGYINNMIRNHKYNLNGGGAQPKFLNIDR